MHEAGWPGRQRAFIAFYHNGVEDVRRRHSTIAIGYLIQ
jgi:hypothetical protein